MAIAAVVNRTFEMHTQTCLIRSDDVGHLWKLIAATLQTCEADHNEASGWNHGRI